MEVGWPKWERRTSHKACERISFWNVIGERKLVILGAVERVGVVWYMEEDMEGM